MSENEKIKEIIVGLDHYKKPYRGYIRDILDGKEVKIDGYLISRDTWCWLIRKYFDNPAYKWEPLLKIIPITIEPNKIPDVLDLQSWIYV